MLSIFSVFLKQVAPPAQQGQGVPPWLWILIFLLVVLVVWWLLTRSAKEEPPHIEAHHAEEAQPEPAEAEIEAPAPLKSAAPEPVVEAAPPAEPPKPDDLTLLEGVGPKVQSVLQAAGILTFAQLAAADPGKLKEILEAANYPYMDPASWPEQAQLLAKGDMETFQKLTDALKGGRKV
ncbi:MAG: hypothetical protein AB1894_27785 [Chloroflexota bacterium]